MSTQRSTTGRGAASRSRWVASSAVAGASPLAAAEAAPLAKRAAQRLLDHRRPGGAAHLVLKCAWCRASAICGQAGMQFLGRPKFALSGDGGPGPAAGRCPGSLAAARTARPPPGPRASLWEPRIFHPGPLVSIGRVFTSRPAHWTYPTCLERVRAGRTAHKRGKMEHHKRLPKVMRKRP